MCTYSTALLLDIILSVHAYSHFKFLYKSMLIRKVIKIHPQTCKKCITLITCHPVNILNRMQISILKGKILDSQPLSYSRLQQQSGFPPFKEYKIQGLFQDFQDLLTHILGTKCAKNICFKIHVCFTMLLIRLNSPVTFRSIVRLL